MGRLIVRSKSHQRLQDAYAEPRAANKDVSTETTRLGLTVVPPVAKSRYASPASTPGFEVLSRPKTANAAMDDEKRKRLMAMGSPISVTEGQDIFNFPTPLRESPQPPLMSKFANSPLALRPNLERTNTPDTIGIALGSPSHLAQFESLSPMPGGLYVASPETVTPMSTPGLREVQEQKSEPVEPSKQKVSRWRSVFGRKKLPRDARQPEEASSRNQPARAGLGLDSYHTWEQNAPRSPARLRSGTDPRHIASPQSQSPVVGINRAQTAPTGRRNAGSPLPPPKDFLDIEIPSVKMDRYSVMFNGILPTQTGGLLARRQSRRENANAIQQPTSLKDLDIPPVPRRRNTTTSPTASPSYRLLVFPPEKSSAPRPLERQNSLLHRPRPLKRSNTAPGALSPGLQSKYNQLSPMSEASESETPVTDIAPSTSNLPEEIEEEDYPLRDSLDRQALTPTPSEPSTPTTPHSIKSFNPFQTTDPHARKGSGTSFDSNSNAMREPDWEMITIGKLAEPGDRFSDVQRVRVVEDENASPVDAAQANTQQTWHPLRMNSLVNKQRPAHLLAGATMTTQPLPGRVEVQIARSMSVTKASGAARPVLRTSPRGFDAGRGENLVEKRALVPSVVVPGPNAFAKGHKPMKSVAGSIVEMA